MKNKCTVEKTSTTTERIELKKPVHLHAHEVVTGSLVVKLILISYALPTDVYELKTILSKA